MSQHSQLGYKYIYRQRMGEQENISKGQRIESFVFEYDRDGEWKEAAKGTTVGYKRLLQFEPVTAKKLRLRIVSSRLNPFLAEIGIYKQPSLNGN